MKTATGIENKNHYFSDSAIEKITEDTFMILENVGIKILDDNIILKLKNEGYAFKGSSVLIQRAQARSFLELLQTQTIERKEKIKDEETPVKFMCSLNGYSDNIENHKTSKISLFDTSTLIDTTKYCSAIFKDYGYHATMPGLAHDVHPDLIPLLSCKIGAQYIDGGWGPDVYSINIMPYMLDMCEVMDEKIEQVSIYMINPLILAGESFEVALALKDEVDSIKVRTLPTLGVTTPLDIPAAISLSFAEVLGGAFIIHELTGCKMDIAISLFPFDFRDLNIMYGSVEKQVLGFMVDELNIRLNLITRNVSKKVNLTNVSKVAGPQSFMNNAQTITAGALTGGRSFKALGSLSCGEVFSPIQMVADFEMIQRANILVNGMNMQSDDQDILDKIQCDENKNFFDSEKTLFHHQEHIWYPKFFDRSPLGSWQAKGSPKAKDKIIDYIEKMRSEKSEYRLDDLRFNALEEIYIKAKRQLR